MPRVLLTAYGAYDHWETNASWLVLQHVTRDLPANIDLQTRLYPVDFEAMAERLQEDLTADINVALHLGQAPGRGRVDLEAVGVNVARDRDTRAEDARPLVPGAPAAYCSSLPLKDWAQRLRQEGIPAEVSHHAGTYLCNAIHYLTHHLSAERGLGIKATFLHVPLDPTQVVESASDMASLPVEVTALGVRMILDDIAARVAAG